MTKVRSNAVLRRGLGGVFLAAALAPAAHPQTSFTWQELRDKFEAANPTLKAAQVSIDESKASEITAYLRPNPTMGAGIDQISPFATQLSPSGSGQQVYRPFANTFPFGNVSYLHERQHKRELRRDAARQTTTIAQTGYADQERTLLFTLRNAFVQVLQAKAFLQNAKDNLEYWDKGLSVQRKRYAAGDLALIDLNRLELQRVQFETDYETAIVNLRTNKIQLLNLLNDRTPIEQFDVTGKYDFAEVMTTLEELRNAAMATRPDLRVAMQTVELARISHKLAVANGSADPTFGLDVARNPPIPAYFGVNVSIPLRIFDKNQGEKLRTQLDIGRSQRLEDAARAQVFNDVDSAYYTIVQTLNLLKPYKTRYLPLALDIRDRMATSFQNGGNSFLDYLDAQKAYRDTQLAYLNLIGAYMTAAAQMNLAVGREILP